MPPTFELCKFNDAFPYMLAQFLGAAVAALFYRFLFARSIGDEKDIADQGAPAF